MKIALQYLKEVQNVADFPVFSLLLFFGFFLLVSLFAYRMPTKEQQMLSEIPLNDSKLND